MTAARWRKLHGYATLTWIALVIPTVMWWRHSILWIALMSVWANVGVHFSAWQGARAEDASERVGT